LHRRPLTNPAGRIVGAVIAQHDITDYKKAIERIWPLLEEKETPLREIHHRIKNTMNTMVGVLMLEADNLDYNPDAIAALNDAANRVRSMEILYDQLYRTETQTSASL